MTESEWFEQLFNRLSHSKFRSSFHLKQKDKEYIQAKGINVNLKMYSFDHLRMYNIDHINTCCSRW